MISYGTPLTNTLVGTFGGKFEKIPLIIIGAVPPLKRQVSNEKKALKVSHWMFKGVTVESMVVPYSNLAAEVIDQAFTKCWTLQKPVYLEIPQDVFSYRVEEPKKKISREYLTSQRSELKKSVDEIKKMFTKSKIPLVLVGEEIIREDVENQLEEFLSKSKVKYVTTLTGKTAVSEKSKNFAGVFMGRSCTKNTYEIIKKSDFILCLGSGLIQNSALSIYMDDLPQKEFIYAYNGLVRSEHFNFGPVVMKDLLIELKKSIEPVSYNENYDYVPSFEKANFKGDLSHDGIVKKISQSGLLKESITYADTSVSLFTVGNIRMEESNSFICEGIWQTRGYPLCASIGGFKGTSKRPVVFLSDGGLHNMYHSISTHVMLKTKCIIFVFNNGINALTQWHQNPQAFEREGKIDEFNVLPKVDWEKCGNSFGAKVFNVKSYDDLEETLKKLKDSDDVCLVMMKIPQKDLPENALWKVKETMSFEQ